MFRGFYINLARSDARNRKIQDHLSAIGIRDRYERFEAIEGATLASRFETTLEPGALGCWLSHVRLLENSRGLDKHLHVLEDDAILTRDARTLFDPLLRLVDQKAPEWELLFTDIYVDPELAIYIRFNKTMRHFDARRAIAVEALADVDFAATTSYFVNRNSIDKVARLLDHQWSSNLPIDLFIRTLAQSGQLNAFVSVPFLSTIDEASTVSDIRGAQDISRNVAMIFRQGFFKDADYQQLHRALSSLTEGTKVSPLDELYLRHILFTLSSRHVGF